MTTRGRHTVVINVEDDWLRPYCTCRWVGQLHGDMASADEDTFTHLHPLTAPQIDSGH